jgi:hypothetical protein
MPHHVSAHQRKMQTPESLIRIIILRRTQAASMTARITGFWPLQSRVRGSSIFPARCLYALVLPKQSRVEAVAVGTDDADLPAIRVPWVDHDVPSGRNDDGGYAEQCGAAGL